jgi:Pyruvate/2-oxoacid:ferredoxin oxidoreductase gamma subunit
MRTQTTNIIMLGIGGQGTLTFMEMLAMAAEAADEEVRVLSRVSLARLGGSGMCHMRLGPAASPSIPAGEADILIALEMSEVLRALPMARKGALAFINTYRRVPIAAGVAGLHYPTQAEIERALQEAGVTGIFVPELLPESMLDAGSVCRLPTDYVLACGSRLLGSRKGMINSVPTEDQQHDSRINIIMLGVFAGYTRLLPRSLLEQAITQRLPRFAEQNLHTFTAGWNYGVSLHAPKIA